MHEGSICVKCKYCRAIQIDGLVLCELGIGGRAKTYCRGFAPREAG